MNSKILNNIAVAIILIALAVISRLIPHLWNFTSVGAVILFSTFYFKNKQISYLIPLAIIMISDLCLLYLQNKPLASTGIYICFLLYIPLGSLIIKEVKTKNIALAGISGATLFFITSNFLVWIPGTMYPLSLSGLITCYTAAIPFFLNHIAGNLFWSFMIFGIYQLSVNSINNLSLDSRNNY